MTILIIRVEMVKEMSDKPKTAVVDFVAIEQRIMAHMTETPNPIELRRGPTSVTGRFNREPQFVHLENYMRQAQSAEETMRQLDVYAREIGCAVNGDSIETTGEQAQLLAKKFEELNRGR